MEESNLFSMVPVLVLSYTVLRLYKCMDTDEIKAALTWLTTNETSIEQFWYFKTSRESSTEFNFIVFRLHMCAKVSEVYLKELMSSTEALPGGIRYPYLLLQLSN